MSYQPGDLLLDKYRIEKTLGQGAFGEVYLVTHLRLNVPRAIKVLRKDLPGWGVHDYENARNRFRLEAQLGAQLNIPVANPHLLQVQSYEEQAELLLLEMEYAPGGNLQEKLKTFRERGENMPVSEVLQVGLEVAQGLASLHAMDIVHRDIKPANILFDGQGHARLADMGIAQTLDDFTLRSQLGTIAPPHPGTGPYMSPEQATTQLTLQPPSDIYTLGVVLFEMLTGRNYAMQKAGTRASSLCDGIPIQVDELLARMLAKDPEDRPWDGKETTGLLREILGKIENAQAEVQRKLANKKVETDTVGKTRLSAAATVNGRQVQTGGKAELISQSTKAVEQIRLDPGSSSGKSPSDRFWKVRRVVIALVVVIWIGMLIFNNLPAITKSVPLTAMAKELIGQANPPAKATLAVDMRTDSPSNSQPGIQNPIPSPNAPIEYTVQPGDNLYNIALKFNLGNSGIQKLLALNSQIDPVLATLSIGQKIMIPNPDYQFLTRTPLPTNQVTSINLPRATIDSKLAIGSTQTREKDGMVMVYVPAGPFTMGSDNSFDAEKPAHTVSLDAFWIDKTEVNNKMFQIFVKHTGYKTDSEKAGAGNVFFLKKMNWELTNGADWQHPQGPNSNLSGMEEHPVIQVSWNDSKAYCEWAGGRLPSESEWEKAARGSDERSYPWGEGINKSLANYGGNVGDTTNVGSYESGKSPYGAVDMAGNVWEWVDDWYAAYPGNNISDQEYGKIVHVLRGGAWSGDEKSSRSTVRGWQSSSFSNTDMGFRCARSQ